MLYIDFIYSLEELLSIDPKLIILAPFTVPTDIPAGTLTAYGRQVEKNNQQRL